MEQSTKQIFNYIQGMNPIVSTVSSMGSFVTNLNQQVADRCVSEVIQALSDKKDTLAYKIATSLTDRYTDKQLWVIAFELQNNVDFTNKVISFYAEIDRKSNAKIEASKAKLAANKEASTDILAPIKEAKKLGEFGKWLNTPGNVFRKEHFSKKYTQESVNTFLSLTK